MNQQQHQPPQPPPQVAQQPPPHPPQYAQPRPQVVVVDNGSSNAIAALASFFFPGLGQLIQGRVGAAFGFFCFWLFGIALCFVFIGIFFLPLVWIGSIIDAAKFRR
ncbi:MAG: hypothetical protein AAFU85_02155 [Planctomycetota bacterium]